MITKTAIILILLQLSVSAQQKYSLVCDRALIIESRKLLSAQVGTIEQGRNSGERITRYLKSVGLSTGNPYCAAGQYWCFATACKRLKFEESLIPIPKTGLANGLYEYAEVFGIKVKYRPAVDDLIVWRYPNSLFGHIERITTVERAGWVITVGFNTKKIIKGRRVEGVFIHRRNIFHPLRRMYIRGLVGFHRGGGDDS